MASPNEALRVAGEQTTQLGVWLKAWIRHNGRLMKEVSRQMGLAPAYLTRAFAGAMPLRLRVVFDIFAVLGQRAQPFFERHYPYVGVGPPTAGPGRFGGEDEGEWTFREILERLRAEAPEPSPAELVERAARHLRWKIGCSGMKQSAVSQAIGSSPRALGAALRKAEGLTTRQLFATLHVIGLPPARFFAELFTPEAEDLALGAGRSLSRDFVATALPSTRSAGDRGAPADATKEAPRGKSPTRRRPGPSQPGERGKQPGSSRAKTQHSGPGGKPRRKGKGKARR